MPEAIVKKKKNILTPEQIRERHKKNRTLIITYNILTQSKQKVEGFRNCKDPGRILSRRNARMISSVTYMGEPYDFSKHQALYPIKTNKNEIKKSEASESGGKKKG